MVYSGNVAGDAGSRLVRVTKILGLVTAVLLRKQERRERCCGLREAAGAETAGREWHSEGF